MTKVCSDVLVIVSPSNSMYPSLMHANFCVCQSPFYRNQLLFAKKYKAFLLFFVCSTPFIFVCSTEERVIVFTLVFSRFGNRLEVG